MRASAEPFQRCPFVAAELLDGRFVRLFASPIGPLRWRLAADTGPIRRLAAALTDRSGATALSEPFEP
jgi:hypothetical protein